MAYYYVESALPPLTLKTKPEISFADLIELIELNCEERDREKFFSLRSYIDIKNLLLFWIGKSLDERGNLSRKKIEEALLTENFFPDFVFEFLKEHQDIEFRIRHFLFLLSRFLQMQIEKQRGFLQAFFRFEREYMLVLSALRAKALNRDLVWELQYEDVTDLLVQSIVMQKDQKEYIPPKEYEELKNLYEAHSSLPGKLYEVLEKYRFRKIQSFGTEEFFTMDRILAYASCLMLIEDQLQLSEEKGRKLIASLC